MQQRIEKLRKILSQKKLDALFITNFYNILYFTGFRTVSPEERDAYAVVTKNNVYLLTDRRHEVSPASSLTILWLERNKRLLYQLAKIIQSEKIKTLGFESEDLKHSEFTAFSKHLTGIRFAPTLHVGMSLRQIKDEEEIEMVKKACEISDQCLHDIAKTIQVGQTEKEIAFRLEFWIKKRGHENAFPPIVAVDANAAIPHYDTQEKGDGVVKNGSVILMDFGAKYNNYCSDMTRMLFMKKPKNTHAQAYAKLLEAQEKTIQQVRHCRKTKSVDLFCRKLIEEKGLLHFTHSTGHGVGLEIHEEPKIALNSKDEVQPNQIFTIEPGIYYQNEFGMRIEDTVAIDKNRNAIPLTRFPKKLLVL